MSKMEVLLHEMSRKVYVFQMVERAYSQICEKSTDKPKTATFIVDEWGHLS